MSSKAYENDGHPGEGHGRTGKDEYDRMVQMTEINNCLKLCLGF